MAINAIGVLRGIDEMGQEQEINEFADLAVQDQYGIIHLVERMEVEYPSEGQFTNVTVVLHVKERQ